MKRTIVACVVCLSLFASGCRVMMSASYRKELDSTVVLARQTARLAVNDEIPQSEMVQALKNYYVVFRLWQDACDGIDKINQQEYIDSLYAELEEVKDVTDN